MPGQFDLMVAEKVFATDAADDHIISDTDDSGSANPGNRAGVANAGKAEAVGQNDGGK